MSDENQPFDAIAEGLKALQENASVEPSPTPVDDSTTKADAPATAPTSAAFFGVDRSPDVTLLGGIRLDISSYNPEEGLVVAMNCMARDGVRPSHLFMNFTSWEFHNNE